MIIIIPKASLQEQHKFNRLNDICSKILYPECEWNLISYSVAHKIPIKDYLVLHFETTNEYFFNENIVEIFETLVNKISSSIDGVSNHKAKQKIYELIENNEDIKLIDFELL